MGGPVTSERATTLTTVLEEGEKGGKGEGEKKPDPKPQTPNPETLEDDDDEEVSWQSAARASLEKNKPLAVKSASAPVKPSSVKPADPKLAPVTPANVPVAKKVEPVPQQPLSKPEAVQKAETPPSAQVAQAPTPPDTDLPDDAQFTREELPADFWSAPPEPPPPSNDYNDEDFETAVSTPRSGAAVSTPGRNTPKATAKLPFDMPLFNELQSLFPGKIVRIDKKQQKQTEESEESTAPTNEAASVVESEEREE